MTYKKVVFKLLDALESAVCGEGGDGWGMLILTSSNMSMEQLFEIVKEWNTKRSTWWEVVLEGECINIVNYQEFMMVTNTFKFNTENYECVIRY